MSIIRSAVLVSALLVGLNEAANAEFQTFNDEASFLAALGTADSAGEALGPAPADGDALAVSDTIDPSGPFYGPYVDFTAGANPFVALGGWFLNYTAGPIFANLDGSDIAAFESFPDEPGFFGVVVWDGFQSMSFRSAETTEWMAQDFTIAYADSVVPEPASATLFGIGALGLLGYGARRRKKLNPVTA